MNKTCKLHGKVIGAQTQLPSVPPLRTQCLINPFPCTVFDVCNPLKG